VIGEDDGLVAGEQRIEGVVVEAVGCSAGGCRVIRSTTLTRRMRMSGT
jgi:hypothetical protein